MAKRTKLDVSTVFGAVDNTKGATDSATRNIGRVGGATGKVSDKLGMMGGKLGAVAQLMKAGGPLSAGLAGVGGGLATFAFDVARTSENIDNLVGRMGELGRSHGPSFRQLGFTFGEGFLEAAQEFARGTTPEEFAREAAPGGAVDIAALGSVPFDDNAALSATIRQAFDLTLKEAIDATAQIYDILGSARFSEIADDIQVGAEGLGKSGVSIEAFLALVEQANMSISTPRALGEVFDELGRKAGDTTNIMGRLFEALDGDLEAVLRLTTKNDELAKEFGELSRPHLPDLKDAIVRNGLALDLSTTAALDNAKAAKSFSKGLGLLLGTWRGNLGDSIGGLVDGPIAALTDSLYLLAGRDELVGGSGRTSWLGRFVADAKEEFSNVTAGLGQVVSGLATVDDLSGGILGFLLGDRGDSSRLKTDVLAENETRLLGEIEGLRNSRAIKDPRRVGGVKAQIAALEGELNVVRSQMFAATAPDVVVDEANPFADAYTRGGADAAASFNHFQPVTADTPAANDSYLMRATEQLVEGLRADAKENAEMITESVNNNTMNREDTTDRMIEEQRLIQQGAC